MKETTIIFNNGSNVALGMLEITARRYHHIRLIEDALQGGTALAEEATLIPIDDVTLYEGFQYQALIDFQDRNRAVLLWRGSRQTEVNTVREKAMAGVEAKVTKEMKAWEKENPEPIRLYQEIPENLESSESLAEPEVSEPDEAEAEHSTLCSSTFNTYPCELPEGHEDTHLVNVDDVPWKWTDDQADGATATIGSSGTVSAEPTPAQEPLEDFRQPADPPTPEEAQESTENAPNPEDEAELEWAAKCHSLKGSSECALPTDHDEMHAATTDPTDGDALRWTDEAADGDMPF